MLQLTTVVKNIIIINVIFFFATFVFENMGVDLKANLSCYYFESDFFRPWQLITHMFMHDNLAHIFFNMYAVVIFGPALESKMGPKRFLFYYLSCGFGALLLHMGVEFIEIRQAMSRGETSFEVSRVLGASGAVFGILIAFGMLYAELRLRLLFPPIEIKAKWLVVIYGAIELVMAIRNSPNDHIAHYAHLGGMLFGFIMIKYWKRNNMVF
jgi:membrane associated rhomboid family serine protease